ncbi:MAG: hypothetical protein KVP17_003071 [Porospora cf. gigantea B]|uniref:uncharacterized protein n=1 Tax=Porospora cf. gigantea B TaxID=2853592 RepID=UPI0035717D8C|nr:MAG: hypothetical protein KVP17_003071 [Porospora cf. gigantea B]
MHVSPFRLSDKSEDDIAQQFVGRTGIPSETVDIQERARLSPASLNIEGPPDVEFDDVQSLQKFWPRLGWLVGLLLFQSVSSFILRRFEGMIQHHTAVVLFLTMLVGAGGNAGGQSVVLGVRGLALGNIVIGQNASLFVAEQISTAIFMGVALFIVALIRVMLFDHDLFEVLAIGVSMFLIVVIGVAIGSIMPIAFKRFGLDPAHASAAIQVIMDILGVTVVMLVCQFVLAFDKSK